MSQSESMSHRLVVFCVRLTFVILSHRETTARSAVRLTTTSPAIMGISGNFMVFSTEEEGDQLMFHSLSD